MYAAWQEGGGEICCIFLRTSIQPLRNTNHVQVVFSSKVRAPGARYSAQVVRMQTS